MRSGYFRFPLSLRLVGEVLLERGILISYEITRRCALTFKPISARRLRRKRPSRCDVWHLAEVVVTFAGKKHWLGRMVDQDGYVLDEILRARRNTKTAKRRLKRLLKRQGCPSRQTITGKLGSYAAPDVSSCKQSSIARTPASIVRRRTRICLCEGESGRCRAFYH
jgi:putative transposase